ncbi:pilus assembly protein [Acinetobacter rathckeae]|uniref:PilC/PilY family type IV pilus protein n=1 Tax=Acinetobacter rathckeae TaxID=2605272 RepID=UPI0018A28A34|nr:PilC/PilY family type IV pilus protein [Acinetobacter rathckeae]MBF7688402.1 pilus assembly protein PilY [Acinetobacter rathckeae]MBF7695487.1 pilus assembly protein PilY [Acinetobacter rathckeae]
MNLNQRITLTFKNAQWIGLLIMACGGTQASHSSDIEIYQAGTKSAPTIMFLLDISGSMAANIAGKSACDIPSGYDFVSTQSEDSTTTPLYTRNYCSVKPTGSNISYFYKKTTYRYGSAFQSCKSYWWGNPPSTSQADCNYSIPTPSTRELSNYKTITSGSTTYYVQYSEQKFYDRITKVKDGMFAVLQGSSIVSRLSDDKVIGLAAFSYNGEGRSGYIIDPAKPLSATVSGNDDQRTTLLAQIAKLSAYNGTPTAHAYAEVAAYLMGTTTKPSDVSGMDYAVAADIKNSATQYKKPDSFNSGNTQCTGQGIYVLTDGQPNATTPERSKNIMNNALTPSYASSQICSANLLKLSEIKGNYYDIYQSGWPRVYGDDNAWLCIGDFSQLLLDKTKNPLGRQIKTAVVGFGSEFNGLTSYSPSLTQQQNIDNINNSNAGPNVKNAAKWGVYGQGGWYVGSNAQDVVTSVNTFINNTTGEVPPVTTGSATVPIDNLNPLALRNTAYFSQFQPTPDKNYQLWLGNLKKYVVDGGFLKDQNQNNIQNSAGEIISNYDFWAQSSTDLVGGGKARLPLGVKNDSEFNRVVWTNRDGFATNNLRKIGMTDLQGSSSEKGYLLSLLGFNIDLNNVPSTMNDLKATDELRQVGSILHSSPLLLTNEGIIKVENNNIVTKERKDYIVFGTTQGLLHVVDAVSGVEKFAFVPSEIIDTQKQAFSKVDSTSDGIGSLFYGIDAPWTSYTEYVSKDSSAGRVTVGEGENNAVGKQIIYGGLRMGGRGYYALDLKDMDNPSLLFRVGPQNEKVFSKSSDVTAKNYPELAFLGQSWAKPTVGWVNWNQKKRLVLFISGGYDAGGYGGDGYFDYSVGKKGTYAGYESPSYNQSTQQGAGVYMFDALTGELLWWAGANATASNTSATVQYTTAPEMKYSVVSQIRTVDRNLDGLVDHLYFGDLGGQVWRIDLNNNAPDSSLFAKTPVRLMNLNNGPYSPRFYDMPAFSLYRKDNQLFAVLSIGSGNRSSPMFNTTDSNYKDDAIYNIYDKDVVKSRLFNIDKNNQGKYYYTDVDGLSSQDATLNNTSVAKKIVAMGDANVETSAGWYYGFKTTSVNALQTRKVSQMPIIVNNDMYVTTFNNTQNGVSGACGAGVKGKSSVSLFCMPYGQCNGGVKENEIGVGIVAPSVVSPAADGYDRTLVSTVASVLNGTNPFNKYKNNQKIIPRSWAEVGQ